jgi:cellulose synthase/poly-beta-1,6-N-acetylglucosamine synthase-like glycosyltransferase
VHSVVGVYGALYAIRRQLYQPLPSHFILDDMLVPFNIIWQGYRVLFEPQAIAYESTKKNLEIEIERRKRTITGNFQLVFERKELLNLKKNPIWLQLFLHKFIRLLFPALFFLLFISNLFIANHPFYHATLLAQILFYGLCLLSIVFKKPVFFYVFGMLNLAVVQSFVKYLRNTHSVKWQKQN